MARTRSRSAAERFLQVSAGSLGWFAVIALLSAGLGARAETKPALPGKAGVYCKLNDVIGSDQELKRTMAEIKAAGIDFILPYTKLTSGKVRWASRVAAPEMIDTPDFLERVIRAAHAAGLKVYPVFCVCTEGGDETPNAVLKANPSWAFVREGKPIGYIDPGNAAARAYQANLMAEMAANYPIDGISLDYMRMPNRIGYTQTAREEFLKRKKVDLSLITREPAKLDSEGGKAAAKSASARTHPVWPEYREWRRQQINGFMKELRRAVHRVRPGLPFSTYCWGAHTMTGNFETSQDWASWIRDGQLEWVNPSGYRYTDEAFTEAANLNRKAVPQGFPYYITVGVSTSHGKLQGPAELRKQMAMSREAGADGLVFFTWEALRKFMPESGADIRNWQPRSQPGRGE